MIRIVIRRDSWALFTPQSGYVGHPDKPIYEGHWSSGPIEIARILRRLGLALQVEVEP